MDNRYWIAKNCTSLLESSRINHILRLSLEVKLLKIRTLLLRQEPCDRAPSEVCDLTPFNLLLSLMNELNRSNAEQELFENVSLHLDSLLRTLQEETSG